MQWEYRLENVLRERKTFRLSPVSFYTLGMYFGKVKGRYV